MTRRTATQSVKRLQRFIEENKHSPQWELEGLLLDVNALATAAMELRQISRSELAERLGTSRAYVTKLLDGQENMTLKTLVRVANALEMKVETKFVPRERAAKPAKKRTVKTAVGPKMRGPASSKKAAPTHTAVAARSRK